MFNLLSWACPKRVGLSALAFCIVVIQIVLQQTFDNNAKELKQSLNPSRIRSQFQYFKHIVK